MVHGQIFTSLPNRRTQLHGLFSLVTHLLMFLVVVCVGFPHQLKSSLQAETSLRFVNVVFRHGERAPERRYPLDPNRNAPFWGDGPGELVPKGKRTEFELGKFLRSRYDGFISSRYKPTEIQVISSSYDRCLMSAQLAMAGLFPPSGNQIWNPNLLWQPIPVHMYPPSCDEIILASKPCPVQTRELKYMDTHFFHKIEQENQLILSNMSKHTGLTIKTLDDVYYIYDNLVIAKENNFPIPEWAHENYHKIEYMALITLLFPFDTPVMKKFRAGVLLHEMISSMKNKTNPANNFERLLNVYSAHDTTISGLWQALEITEEVERPPYGAIFIIELHEISGKFKVKIIYRRNATDEDMIVLQTKGCENDPDFYEHGMCDLETFSTALKSVTIANYDKECQIPR